MTKNRKRKKVDFMIIATALQEEDRARAREVDLYIERLKSMPKEDAKKASILALQRTGVLDKTGKAKKKIVSWE